MHPLLELVESHGIVSLNDLPKVGALPKRKLITFYERLYAAVFQSQSSYWQSEDDGEYELDPFSFMASSSMRADSGCQELPCRLTKLDFLARLTALYANRVTLPLPLTHPDKVLDVESARGDLFLSLTSLLVLRSLIENRLVLPVVMRTSHCEHVKEFIDEMVKAEHKVADLAAKEFASEFELTFQLPERSPSGQSTIYIEGPEDFLDHGSLVALFDEPPQWRAKSWKYDEEGRTEIRGLKKLYFVKKIFNTIANDTTFYLASGQIHRSRLLTDRPGEAFLLTSLNQNNQLMAASAAMNLLSHSIPILENVPISTLIRIRKEERDSFASYRSTITSLTSQVLAETGSLSKRSAREAFKTKLEPEIGRIRKEIKAERRKQKNRLALGASALAASVIIGAIGGIPILLKAVLTGIPALAATGPLRELASSACNHGTDIRQKNDLYFLARLVEDNSR